MSFEREKLSYTIGMRIKEFRTERKMSQENLALTSGIHPDFLGKVERGERCPTIDTLYKICSGLKIPMSTLLDFSIDPEPTSEEAVSRIKKALSKVPADKAVKIAQIIEEMTDII